VSDEISGAGMPATSKYLLTFIYHQEWVIMESHRLSSVSSCYQPRVLTVVALLGLRRSSADKRHVRRSRYSSVRAANASNARKYGTRYYFIVDRIKQWNKPYH
jgi:hypothetical protein